MDGLTERRATLRAALAFLALEPREPERRLLHRGEKRRRGGWGCWERRLSLSDGSDQWQRSRKAAPLKTLGRPLQGRGRRFEPCSAHHNKLKPFPYFSSTYGSPRGPRKRPQNLRNAPLRGNGVATGV
jgi:hypothetical protein